MIKFELPDEAFWAAVGTVVLIGGASFIRFIRWQGDVLTKKEHARICGEGQTAIINMLKDQNRTTSEFRQQSSAKMDVVASDVGQLKTDVAVLKEQVKHA